MASRGLHPSSVPPLQKALCPDPCAPLKDRDPPLAKGLSIPQPSAPTPIRTSLRVPELAALLRRTPAVHTAPSTLPRKALHGPAFGSQGTSRVPSSCPMISLCHYIRRYVHEHPVSLFRNTPTPPQRPSTPVVPPPVIFQQLYTWAPLSTLRIPSTRVSRAQGPPQTRSLCYSGHGSGPQPTYTLSPRTSAIVIPGAFTPHTPQRFSELVCPVTHIDPCSAVSRPIDRAP